MSIAGLKSKIESFKGNDISFVQIESNAKSLVKIHQVLQTSEALKPIATTDLKYN